jgi:hypothetical protein
MCGNRAKLRIISVVLLLSWLIAAYSGGEVLCVETQGGVQFEAGWMTECCVSIASGAADCSTLTCEQCKHYPLQLCAVHRGHGGKIGFAVHLFPAPQFHSVITRYPNIAYQPVLCIPTDTLRSAVMII